MNVLIFKTNIRFKKDIKIITSFLSTCNSILKWNIDRHDSDKILRIESTTGDSVEIINAVNHAGYHCEELQD